MPEKSMPHVIVKLYPGRTEKKKKQLAEAIAKSVATIALCEEKSVSVAIEEVEKDDWTAKVYQPDIVEKKNTLYKKPGYNPFR
jgi:4-oxalocrotonate tautomerase